MGPQRVEHVWAHTHYGETKPDSIIHITQIIKSHNACECLIPRLVCVKCRDNAPISLSLGSSWNGFAAHTKEQFRCSPKCVNKQSADESMLNVTMQSFTFYYLLCGSSNYLLQEKQFWIMNIGFLISYNFSEIHGFSDGSMWLLKWVTSEHTKNNFDPYPCKKVKLVKTKQKKHRPLQFLEVDLRADKHEETIWKVSCIFEKQGYLEHLSPDTLPLSCWRLRLTRIHSGWVWLGGWGSLFFHL